MQIFSPPSALILGFTYRGSHLRYLHLIDSILILLLGFALRNENKEHKESIVEEYRTTFHCDACTAHKEQLRDYGEQTVVVGKEESKKFV